jgi:hypothetical protein
MNEMRAKIEQIADLRNDVDEHVWDVFIRYCQEFNVNFTSPEHWTAYPDSITFSGEDGCMGSYDSKHLSIPMEFFDDFVSATANQYEAMRLEKERKAREELEYTTKMKRIDEARERAYYERLKKKFESS